MPWLTVLEDSSSPRPGEEELYFRGTPDTEIRRPPIIRYALPSGPTGPYAGRSSGLPPQGDLTMMAAIAGGAAGVILLLLLLWFLRGGKEDVAG
ncbi:MAG: hypothetical protein U0736_20860 [Gemmataceae bacterium]